MKLYPLYYIVAIIFSSAGLVSFIAQKEIIGIMYMMCAGIYVLIASIKEHDDK